MTPESERITRKLRIDKLLVDAGWVITPYYEGIDISALSNHAVEEYATNLGFDSVS